MIQKDFIQNILGQIFSFMGISPSVELIQNEESIDITVEGDNLNFVIGMHGNSLQALETFLNTISYRNYPDGVRVNIDINNYKASKKEKILEIAKRGIDKVRFFNEEVSLPVMTSSERRFVHNFVSEYDDIESRSIGEEPMRRIVLKKKA